MMADGRVPAQVQGHAPYRTGVARSTKARPQGPAAGAQPEAEGRGPASPVCDAGRGARVVDAGERLPAHGRRGARRQGRRAGRRGSKGPGRRGEARGQGRGALGRGQDPGARRRELGMHEPKSDDVESLRKQRKRRMGRTMGHNRKGETAVELTGPGRRNTRMRRGKKTPPRTTNKRRQVPGGKVIQLSRPEAGRRREAADAQHGASRVSARRKARTRSGTGGCGWSRRSSW